MKYLFTLIGSIYFFNIGAQSSVLFEVESDKHGIQIPIVEQTAITNPVEGLIIYNSDNQLVEWWDKEGFWVTLPSFKPFSSGIRTLDQRFGNRGNMLFTHIGAQQLDSTNNSAWGNTVMGVLAGQSMTQSTANTFIGNEAGRSQTKGHGNTFVGKDAGRSLIEGFANIAIGNVAMMSADSSWGNVVIGSEALRDGQGQTNNNVTIGHAAMKEFSKGWDNVVIGAFAAEKADTLHGAVLIGHRAGYSLSVDGQNTFIGNQSGNKTTSGVSNTFLGFNSGFNNTTGSQNTFIGLNAGTKNSEGIGNVYVGDGAGFGNLGSSNVIIGQVAGIKDDFTDTNYAGNIFIGFQAGRNEEGSNKLYIENSRSADPLIYGEFDSDKVQINGSLTIKDFAKLEPRVDPPATCSNSLQYGIIYYDSSVTPNKIKVCTDQGWTDLN